MAPTYSVADVLAWESIPEPTREVFAAIAVEQWHADGYAEEEIIRTVEAATSPLHEQIDVLTNDLEDLKDKYADSRGDIATLTEEVRDLLSEGTALMAARRRALWKHRRRFQWPRRSLSYRRSRLSHPTTA